MTDTVKLSKSKQLEANKIEARSNMTTFVTSVCKRFKVPAKTIAAMIPYLDERLNDFGNIPNFADSPDTWLVLAPNRVTRHHARIAAKKVK